MPAVSPVPAEIRTPRLLLRRQRPDDAQLVKDAIDASLDHLKAAVGWARTAPFSLPVLIERLTDSAASFDAGTEWAYSIFDLVGTRVLGCAALEPGERALQVIVGADAVEAGYWLRADATGQGYATEATAALIDVAFARLRARRIAICHDPDNAGSAGVPRRLAFRDLGTVADDLLPNRPAADGSIRRATRVWVLEAPPAGHALFFPATSSKGKPGDL